jgi:hypothetical protein
MPYSNGTTLRQPALSTYTDDINPYKQWHMRRAFRLGWEAAEDGLDEEQGYSRALTAKLNSRTIAAWWRGYRTQRNEL